MSAPTMSDLVPLIPSKPVPALEVQTLDGPWSLSGSGASAFTMVVFYRGYHCPVCKKQLLELKEKLGAFTEAGVAVIALSTDGEERARLASDEWGLDGLKIGYGLSLSEARAWGLYLSQSRGMTSTGVEEPRIFNEPGLFLVRPDGTLYASFIQTTPFARPGLDDLLSAIGFVAKTDYPPRGTVETVASVA
ncbi:MAG: peroxiredoxin-like family protein [Pseudomonadota bacterium]